MIHTSGLLRVTDVIKDLRCGVVTIVTLLVDWRNDYSACSTLTCFRGFLHYDMTRSVWWQRMRIRPGLESWRSGGEGGDPLHRRG